MININIEDGDGESYKVKVSKFGQLVIAPIAYTEPIALSMTLTNTGYNLVPPISGCDIVVTDIILGADKNVSATNGAVIEIYESDSSDSVTVLKPIFTIDLLKNQTLPLIGLNFKINQGVWINAKTDDNNVKVTLGYYYLG